MGIDALKVGPLRRLNSQFQEEFVRNCIKLGCIPNGLGEYRNCAKKDISVEGENKFQVSWRPLAAVISRHS